MKKQTKILLGIGAVLAAVGVLVYSNKGKKNFANASGGGFLNATGSKVVLGETKNTTQETNDCADCSYNINISGEILSHDIEIIERGVCWATNSNPSLSDNKVIDYSGKDNFSCEIPNLSPNVLYYIRSYAKDANQVVGYGTKITYKKTIGVPIVSTLPSNKLVDGVTTLENEFDNSPQYKYSYYDKSYSFTTGARVTSVGSCSLSAVGVIYSINPDPSLVDLDGDNPPKVKYLTDYTPLPPKPIVVKPDAPPPPPKPTITGCFYCEELKNIATSAQNVAYTDCYGVKTSKSINSGTAIMVKSGTLTKGNLTVMKNGTSYTVCDGVPTYTTPSGSGDGAPKPTSTGVSCADAKKALEDHKAFMAKSRLTQDGMATAKAKLAELESIFSKSCGTTATQPEASVTDCFECQTWKNIPPTTSTDGAVYSSYITGVYYIGCDGLSYSNQQIAPNQEIQVKSGTLFYPQMNTFDGQFANAAGKNNHDLTLLYSKKVCKGTTQITNFDGGFLNSGSNFLNADGKTNFLNATGEPDGTGDYSTQLILPFNTTIYIRAFATNQYGTTYGKAVVFRINAKTKK